MKTKAEARSSRRLNSRGIRYRVIMYLMAFVAALLALLWLFQIVLLDDFYRWSKTWQIRQTSDTLAANVDNDGLESLMNHLASRSDMCIVLLNDKGKTIIASDDIRFCLIHRMSKEDRAFWCEVAPKDGSVLIEQFSVAPLMEEKVNPRNFRGWVPQASGDRQAL